MNTYSIIGIDPGLVATGIARFDLDYTNNTIINIDLSTILLENFSISYIAYSINPRDARLLGFKDWLKGYLNNYNVVTLGYETPFYNMKRPNAFETLVEVCTVIRHTALEYNPALFIKGLSPPEVKKGIGIKGNSGKEEVERKIKEIYPSLVFGSQHEMDALAVATCLI